MAPCYHQPKLPNCRMQFPRGRSAASRPPRQLEHAPVPTSRQSGQTIRPPDWNSHQCGQCSPCKHRQTHHSSAIRAENLPKSCAPNSRPAQQPPVAGRALSRKPGCPGPIDPHNVAVKHYAKNFWTRIEPTDLPFPQSRMEQSMPTTQGCSATAPKRDPCAVLKHRADRRPLTGPGRQRCAAEVQFSTAGGVQASHPEQFGDEAEEHGEVHR